MLVSRQISTQEEAIARAKLRFSALMQAAESKLDNFALEMLNEISTHNYEQNILLHIDGVSIFNKLITNGLKKSICLYLEIFQDAPQMFFGNDLNNYDCICAAIKLESNKWFLSLINIAHKYINEENFLQQSDQDNFLHLASSLRHGWKYLPRLIKYFPFLINSTNQKKQTPLHLSLEHSLNSMILINRGADLLAKDDLGITGVEYLFLLDNLKLSKIFFCLRENCKTEMLNAMYNILLNKTILNQQQLDNYYKFAGIVSLRLMLSARLQFEKNQNIRTVQQTRYDQDDMIEDISFNISNLYLPQIERYMQLYADEQPDKCLYHLSSQDTNVLLSLASNLSQDIKIHINFRIFNAVLSAVFGILTLLVAYAVYKMNDKFSHLALCITFTSFSLLFFAGTFGFAHNIKTMRYTSIKKSIEALFNEIENYRNLNPEMVNDFYNAIRLAVDRDNNFVNTFALRTAVNKIIDDVKFTPLISISTNSHGLFYHDNTVPNVKVEPETLLREKAINVDIEAGLHF